MVGIGENPASAESVSTRLRKVSWVNKAKSSWIGVASSFIVGFLAGSLGLADKIILVTDRLGWTKSESLALAENSEKSRFSDDLIRSAWHRLILADIFARRVGDDAPFPLIEAAWQAYIQDLIGWNSDIMIYYVGLEKYYGVSKSRDFETVIQVQDFAAVDGAMRALNLSAYVVERRKAPNKPEGWSAKPEDSLVLAVTKATGAARSDLYQFVRCYQQQGSQRRTSVNSGCALR